MFMIINPDSKANTYQVEQNKKYSRNPDIEKVPGRHSSYLNVVSIQFHAVDKVHSWMIIKFIFNVVSIQASSSEEESFVILCHTRRPRIRRIRQWRRIHHRRKVVIDKMPEQSAPKHLQKYQVGTTHLQIPLPVVIQTVCNLRRLRHVIICHHHLLFTHTWR